ncbi:MAG: hypothetical protein Q7T18_08330 [Sedimentisphaerales bacterium]|nr:hypothetical protein [Sedimentisphaerales bacterium]
MGKILELHQSPYWAMALDHLETEWPEKLARLLKNGKLEAYLNQAVQATLNAEYKLTQANPGMTKEQASEFVLKDTLLPENPKYDPENPKQLPEDISKLLQAFKEKHGLA